MIACLNMNNSGNWSLSKRRTALLEPLLTLIRFVFALFHHLVWLIQTLVVLCTRIPMRPSSILLLMWSWLWPNLCDIRPLRLFRISSASSCEPSAKLILVNNNRPEYPLYLTLVNSSSSEDMYPSSNAYNGVNQQLKEHHRRAFQLVSRALKLDEQGDKTLAIDLYRQGINELEAGIDINIRKSGITRDALTRAERLQSQMKTNLEMARDRLEFLSGLSDLHRLPINSEVEEVAHPPRKLLTMNEDCSSTNGPPSSGARLLKKKPVLTPTSTAHTAVSGQVRKPLVSTSRSKPAATTATAPKTTAISRPQNQPLPKTTAGRSAISGPASKALPTTSRRPAQLPHAAPSRAAKSAMTGPIKGVDSKLASLILDEIIDGGAGVSFSDIAGLSLAKQALQEIVILPMLRPELFTGLRTPARGLLLFGPPGNGKTMLARAVATESSATFFNISASSLTSKYVGEGEKMVRALFAVARQLQPSIIFVDEIDSLLCERRQGENDASRRLKTEFLCQFDGLNSSNEEKILVMGATNRPQELDEAVLRRFAKRLYIRLPDPATRVVLLKKLLAKHNHPLTSQLLADLSQRTESYSSSDLTELAKDAALGPIRELGPEQVKHMEARKIRPITMNDFLDSLKRVRHSVSCGSLNAFEKWNAEYGDVSL